VVAVECIFTWYWLADLCAQEGIAFVLGHALYMKAIHGGKAKNDKIDAHKIAVLLRGGMLPMAYVYPREMRATTTCCAAAATSRASAPSCSRISRTRPASTSCRRWARSPTHGNRVGVAEQFGDPAVRKSVETNLALVDHYDRLLTELELHLTQTAKVHDVNAFYRLRSVPGIGKLLALVLLYEIHDYRHRLLVVAGLRLPWRSARRAPRGLQGNWLLLVHGLTRLNKTSGHSRRGGAPGGGQPAGQPLARSGEASPMGGRALTRSRPARLAR
jgi:transposase